MAKPTVIAEFALIIPEEGARPELRYNSWGLVGPLHPKQVDELMGRVRDFLIKELVEGGALVPEEAVIN